MRWRRVGGRLVLAALLGNMLAEPLRALRDFRDTDFATFVSAARLLAGGSRNLYSLVALHASESAYIGFVPAEHVNNAFLNLPLAALVLLPLSGLPPDLGLGIFLGCTLAAMAAGAVLVRRRLLGTLPNGPLPALIAIAAVCSLPAAMNLALGQWDAIMFLAVGFAFVWVVEGRRPMLAGLLLSVLFLKPHLAYLIPLFLVVARQWRVLGGVALGAAGWVLSSWLILGSRVLDLPALILTNDSRQTIETLGVPGFAGMLSGNPATSLYVWLVLVGVVVALTLRYGRALAGRAPDALAVGIAATLAISPHLLGYDLVLLALPVAWWARRSPVAALAAALSTSAAWLVDVTVGFSGPHLETFAVLLVLAGVVLSVARPAAPVEVSRRSPWTPATALPSTPR